MPEYEIVRWDPVIPKDNTFPYPMVYIKPDKNFVDYAKENKFMFLLNITGTGMDYDKAPIIGMVDSSAFYPNFRPYFYNKTGYFVVTLFTNWIGYPLTNGKIKIQGTKGPDNIGNPTPPPFMVPQPMDFYQEFYQDTSPDCKLNKTQLILISILLIIMFIILFMFTKNK